MIKRLELAADTGLHRWQWPDQGSQEAPHLFSRRPAYRKIVVMIDNEVLDDSPARIPLEKAQLLSHLLRHEMVQLYRYADDGPPPEVTPRTDLPDVYDEWPDLYDGWAVVTDHDPASESWRVIFDRRPGQFCLAGVMGNAVQVSGDDWRTTAYSELAPSDASASRRADTLAAEVASQALGADLYITERPYLRESTRVARGVTLCGVDEALPLLGLYFRAQGEFPVEDRFNYNRGLFYWVGTRELLPEAWRWFSACVEHATGVGEESLILLGGSLLQRVDRALEARDAIHIALNRPQNHDIQEDALSQLDVVLFNLMGAVDVAARVAHRVVGLPAGKDHQAGWQTRRWLDQVRPLAPTLASVVDLGTKGEGVLTICRLLRNSVHGAALQGLAVYDSNASTESLVGLPTSDEAAVLRAMNALGGSASWGVRKGIPGRVHVDPGMFVDRLFEGTLGLLNELMAKTPVEKLNHVLLTPEQTQPPPPTPLGEATGSFEPWIRTSIRWQLGF